MNFERKIALLQYAFYAALGVVLMALASFFHYEANAYERILCDPIAAPAMRVFAVVLFLIGGLASAISLYNMTNREVSQ